jgi:ubiquinone/menaquinone biosynthesis C-methylase UbiE
MSENAGNIEYLYSYSLRNESLGFIKDEVAEIRRTIAPFRFSLAANGIVKELGITKENKVLELGCGLGLLGDAIKKTVRSSLKYVGLDLAFKSVKETDSKGLLSVQSKINNLPFPSDSFDFVVTTDVFEHIPNTEMAIKETYRVLKPGGKGFIVIADPSEGRFDLVNDHINRTGKNSDITYWEKHFSDNGFKLLPNSAKYRNSDWRKIFNLPIFAKLKDKAGFACAFNPINRPGVYIVQKI